MALAMARKTSSSGSWKVNNKSQEGGTAEEKNTYSFDKMKPYPLNFEEAALINQRGTKSTQSSTKEKTEGEVRINNQRNLYESLLFMNAQVSGWALGDFPTSNIKAIKEST